MGDGDGDEGRREGGRISGAEQYGVFLSACVPAVLRE